MKTTKNRLPDLFDFRFPVSGFQEDYQKQRSDFFAVSKYEGNVIFGFHEDYQKQRSEFFGFSVSGFHEDYLKPLPPKTFFGPSV